uniref:BEN domain-containing protein n=1 Tax=Anopheles arabiensis TaxID=7173 RepID=A0A182HJU4_ANOAR
MFTQVPVNQHAFIFLKDVSHSALQDLIQFMYCGEVNVKQDALPAFISTAEALQIKGLTETVQTVQTVQIVKQIPAQVIEPEYIELPIESINPKAEPDYTDETAEIETVDAETEQEQKLSEHDQGDADDDGNYVEDDTYGDMAMGKYEESYLTEGEEGAKPGVSGFVDSYTSDGGNATEISTQDTVKFIRSQKKCAQLVYDGYIYNRKMIQQNGRTTWRCCDLLKYHCKATCVTKQNKLIGIRSEHNHNDHSSKIEDKALYDFPEDLEEYVNIRTRDPIDVKNHKVDVIDTGAEFKIVVRDRSKDDNYLFGLDIKRPVVVNGGKHLFLGSRKGGLQLVHDNYLYRSNLRRQGRNGDVLYWECIYNRGQKCRGRLKTIGNQIMITNGRGINTISTTTNITTNCPPSSNCSMAPSSMVDSTVELKFIKSPWSTPCLVLNNFLYNCHSTRGDIGYWRCHNYSRKVKEERCRARCVVKSGRLSALTGAQHNHPPHTEKIERIVRRNYADEQQELEMMRIQQQQQQEQQHPIQASSDDILLLMATNPQNDNNGATSAGGQQQVQMQPIMRTIRQQTHSATLEVASAPMIPSVTTAVLSPAITDLIKMEDYDLPTVELYQRGLPLLVKNKFIYRCERTRNHRSYWLCTRYKTHKCTGRIICQNNTVLKETEHCHMDDSRRLHHSELKLVDMSQIDIECWVKSVPPRFSSSARKSTSSISSSRIKAEKPDQELASHTDAFLTFYLEFILSQRGYPLLVVGNFLFRKNRDKYWRCIRCTKHKCRSRCIIKDKGIVVNIGKHAHGPETAKIQMGRKIRDSAEDDPLARNLPNFQKPDSASLLPAGRNETDAQAAAPRKKGARRNSFMYDLPYEMINNRKGGLNLHFRGYVYRRKTNFSQTTNWVCANPLTSLNGNAIVGLGKWTIIATNSDGGGSDDDESEDNVAVFSRTMRGKEQLVYKGQPFVFEKLVLTTGGQSKKIWRCNQWWNQKCRARVYTIDDHITPLNRYHTHSDIVKRKQRVVKRDKTLNQPATVSVQNDAKKGEIDSKQKMMEKKVPLHAGSSVYIATKDLLSIYTSKPAVYTGRLIQLMFGLDTLKISCLDSKERVNTDLVPLDPTTLEAVITHIVDVFQQQKQHITPGMVRNFIRNRLDLLRTNLDIDSSNNNYAVRQKSSRIFIPIDHSEAMFSESSSGTRQLLYQNHVFHRNIKSGDTEYWRCSKAMRLKCKATIVTKGNMMRFNGQAHNHIPMERLTYGLAIFIAIGPEKQLIRLRGKLYQKTIGRAYRSVWTCIEYGCPGEILLKELKGGEIRITSAHNDDCTSDYFKNRPANQMYLNESEVTRLELSLANGEMFDGNNKVVYIVGQRGSILLSVNGYRYVKNRKSQSKTYWICAKKFNKPVAVDANKIQYTNGRGNNVLMYDGHRYIKNNCYGVNPHIEIYTTKSFRGRPAIIVDKQKYLLMSENSKRIVWRCSSMATEKLKCPARIMQYKDTDQYTFPDKSVHQHAPLKRYKNINCDGTHDMALRFRTSQKGKLQLSYGGFYYCMEKKIHHKEYWRCIYYTTKIKCHGRLHRFDNKVHHMGAHNHAPQLFKRADYKRLSEIIIGYKFVENRQSKRNIFWRCARYVKHGCRAACVTSKNCAGNDQSIRLTGMTHSHPPEDTATASAGAGGEGEEQGQELERIGGQFHAGSMFSFGVSQRGAKKLIYDRYEYIKDREFPLSTNWRCALFKRYNCRARAITKVKNGGYHAAIFGITRRGHQMLLYRGHRYVREKQKGDISNWKCSMHSKYHCKARAVSRKRNGREMMRLTHEEHTHEVFPENGPCTFIPATFGKTRRGQLKLLYDGHAYTRDRQSAKTCNWKCSLFTRYRCRARAVTKDIGGFVHMKVTNTSHYHPKEEYKMKLKKEPLASAPKTRDDGNIQRACFEFTTRGTQCLVYDGYLYSKNKTFENGTRVNWKCRFYHRLHCKARAQTRLIDGVEYVKVFKNEHTHPQEAKSITIKSQYN